jgi:serine protease Do
LNVEIDGDKVTINGKPLSDFNDADVTINKRKFVIRDDHGGNMTFNFDGPDGMPELGGMDRWEDQLKNFKGNGNSHRPFLGVTTEKADDGAKIVEVAKGSAAEKAGLKNGDVITKVGDKEVTDGAVLADIISEKKPKDEVKIAYKREGKKKDVKAVLGEKVEERNFVFNYSPKSKFRSFKSPHVQIAPMPEFNMEGNGNFNFEPNQDFAENMFPRQRKLGLKIQDTEEGGNVKVIDVDSASAAEKAGLKKDDVITEINGQKISNTDDAREQLMEVAEKSAYTIKAKRSGTEMSFEVKIPKKLKTANL